MEMTFHATTICAVRHNGTAWLLPAMAKLHLVKV